MPILDDEQLREIWRDEAVTALQMTPEQLRTRAAQFEASIRRRNLRDHVSFALAAAMFPYGTLLDVVLVRVGSALLVIWAYSDVLGASISFFIAAPADTSAQMCAAYHQRQLERQRDSAFSWPWGIGLALPGILLVIAGRTVGSGHSNWIFLLVMTGVVLFIYVALVIYGKVLAGRCQREINLLQSLKDESS